MNRVIATAVAVLVGAPFLLFLAVLAVPPSPAATATPVHDGRLKKITAPTSIDPPQVQEVNATVRNEGDHTEQFGVYADIVPPGGPSNPFGWLEDPSGINRLIGLYWLSSLFYPDATQEDLRATVCDFYDKFYRTKLTNRALCF